MHFVLHLQALLFSRLFSFLDQAFRRLTQPARSSLVLGTAADLALRKAELIAENALLRHQLVILHLQIKKLRLTRTDRPWFLLLAAHLSHFFVVELASRHVVHFGVTRHPSDAWLSRQLREATALGQAQRFLIRDRGAKTVVLSCASRRALGSKTSRRLTVPRKRKAMLHTAHPAYVQKRSRRAAGVGWRILRSWIPERFAASS